MERNANILKLLNGMNSQKKTYVTLRIIGPVLLVFGFLYWFGGLHSDEWQQNELLRFLPSVSEFLVIPIKFAWRYLDTVVSIGINGKFGLQLITIGYILTFVSMPSKTTQNIDCYKSAYSVSKVIVVTIVIWHWLMQLIEDKDLFEGIFYYIIVFVICYLIGQLVGWLYKKIIILVK